MKSLASSFEGELVEYYDLFFLNNDVSGEVQYIKSIVEEFKDNKGEDVKLLDVGCGTGAHAYEFGRYFDNVLGVDISKDMIAFAKEKHVGEKINYEVQDIRQLRLQNKYDIVTALSHVIGYQLENMDVENMLLSIQRAMSDGGIFIFNFYNEPEILNGSLKPRTQTIENESLKITRFSNATPDTMENELLLDYYYIIQNYNMQPTAIEIHEKMRYFTLKEICYYLDKCGFKLLKAFDWDYCGKARISSGLTSWNAGIAAKKI